MFRWGKVAGCRCLHRTGGSSSSGAVRRPGVSGGPVPGNARHVPSCSGSRRFPSGWQLRTSRHDVPLSWQIPSSCQHCQHWYPLVFPAFSVRLLVVRGWHVGQGRCVVLSWSGRPDFPGSSGVDVSSGGPDAGGTRGCGGRPCQHCQHWYLLRSVPGTGQACPGVVSPGVPLWDGRSSRRGGS